MLSEVKCTLRILYDSDFQELYQSPNQDSGDRVSKKQRHTNRSLRQAYSKGKNPRGLNRQSKSDGLLGLRLDSDLASHLE